MPVVSAHFRSLLACSTDDRICQKLFRYILNSAVGGAAVTGMRVLFVDAGCWRCGCCLRRARRTQLPKPAPACWNSAYPLELCLPAGTLSTRWNSAYLLELCLQRTVVVAVLRHTDCEESGTSFADVTVSDVLGTSFTAACGGPGTS